MVTRNRTKTTRCQPQQIVVNFQPLCPVEIEVLQQLHQQRTTDWVFASERKQRLSERSLHHLIQHAGAVASLPLSVHPYMLRRSGLFFRAALLLEPLGLSLRSCCLIWNWHETSIPFSVELEQEYRAIDAEQESAFLAQLERMRKFSGITTKENIIDYLMGAFLLFPCLQGLTRDHWLAPSGWQSENFAEKI